MDRATTAVLLVLAAAAGSTDAISYLGLGKVFPANMTGNTVLLGIGVASMDHPAAARSAVALAGFLAGAVAAAFGLGSASGRRLLVRGLTGELAVLAGTFVLWAAIGGQPAGTARYWLIVLVSLAMGAQSATVSSLDVGVSTTFITGTWTALCRHLGSRLRGTAGSAAADRPGRRVLVLASYLGAALAAGYAEQAFGALAAAIPPALIAVALTGCLVAGRPRVTAAGPPVR